MPQHKNQDSTGETINDIIQCGWADVQSIGRLMATSHKTLEEEANIVLIDGPKITHIRVVKKLLNHTNDVSGK